MQKPTKRFLKPSEINPRLRLTIAKEPQVALKVEMAGQTILSTHLFLADAFILDIPRENKALIDWMHSYLQGNDSLEMLQFQLDSISPFQKEILTAMQKIPFGQKISYQQLAVSCGRPKAPRAAGGGCKRNPFPLLYPCHRIIRSDGNIGGFALDLEIKKRLLAFEV